METLTHLKTSTSFLRKENKSHSQLVINKFSEACLNLDASIFEPYMNEDDVFEDKGKYQFLERLKQLFVRSQMKAKFNFILNSTEERCRGCSKGFPVLNFELRDKENNSLLTEFGFLIKMENEILTDIYFCSYYKKSHEERYPF